jgi:hypothetical protein
LGDEDEVAVIAWSRMEEMRKRRGEREAGGKMRREDVGRRGEVYPKKESDAV